MGSQRVGHDWSDLAHKQLAGISSEEVCLHVTQNLRWQRPKYERSLLLFFMSRQHRDSIMALWSWGLTLSIWFSKQHQHPASTSVQDGYFSSSCSQTPGRSKRKKKGLTLSITMSITLRTNLRRWAHCLSSLPIGQHMVTWPHQTAEDAGKCSLSSREECVQFWEPYSKMASDDLQLLILVVLWRLLLHPVGVHVCDQQVYNRGNSVCFQDLGISSISGSTLVS